jgi:hypothetical protein
VGAGGSQEASFDLKDDLNAGTWQLAADGIVTSSVDVTFELLLRRAGTDVQLAAWNRHFDKRAVGFDAYVVDLDAPANAVPYQSGDQLVFRYTGQGGTPMGYIPNGDGARANGRIPFIVLP